MSLFVYIGHDPGWVGRHGAGMKSMLLMSLFINEFSCHSCRSLFMYVCLFCKSLFVCMRMLYKRIFFFLQNSCYAYRSLFMRVGLFWQVSFCTYAYVIYVTFFLNSELLLLIQVSFDVCRSLLTRLFVYEWVAMKGELDVMAQVWGVSYMVLLHTCTNSCCCCVCCCFIHVQNVAHSYAYTYMFLSCILVLKYHFFWSLQVTFGFYPSLLTGVDAVAQDSTVYANICRWTSIDGCIPTKRDLQKRPTYMKRDHICISRYIYAVYVSICRWICRWTSADGCT